MFVFGNSCDRDRLVAIIEHRRTLIVSFHPKGLEIQRHTQAGQA